MRFLCSGTQSKPIREFHLSDVSGAQQGRISETDSRRQRSQQVHSMGALQDGRYPSSEAPTAEGRLDGQIGPERRLLCSANPPGAPTLPVCTMEGGNLPIQLSPLRPILSSEGVHEDHAPSDSMAEADGLSDNHLHRRQPSNGIHKGGSQVPGRNIGCTAGSAGISDKYPKSTLEPCQELQFLGFSINSVEMTIRVPQTKLD